MKSGYDNFFKQAKKNAAKSAGVNRPPFQKNAQEKKSNKQLADFSDSELRKIFNLEEKPARSQSKALASRKKFQSKNFGISALGVTVTFAFLLLTSMFFMFPDDVIGWMSRLNFQVMGQASAADQEKTSTESEVKKEDSSSDQKQVEGDKKSETAADGREDSSYFGKLNHRKKQLDLREGELEELERELNKQKVEIEARIQYLEKVRRDIAGVLKDRVEVDKEKVNKLVEFYSNMKPAQAAEIISTINEDLAIGVLSNMKKKNAAAILNMIEPKKARKLSEKFAGYVRN